MRVQMLAEPSGAGIVGRWAVPLEPRRGALAPGAAVHRAVGNRMGVAACCFRALRLQKPHGFVARCTT